MYEIPSVEDRVNFYLSPQLRSSPVVKEKLPNVKYKNFYFDLKWTWGPNGDSLWRDYVSTAIDRFLELGIESPYYPIALGDVAGEGSQFLFSKSRLETSSTKYSLLKCLEEDRHWKSKSSSAVISSHRETLRFSDKKSILVFRGATSGGMFGWDLRSGNRFELIEKYFNSNNPCIDVGFSVFGQGNEEVYSKYIKPPMSIPEQRGCKYILSIEGNDKDSGLQWKLQSNSLVFMPKPKISTWLMETTLIPNYHYIEIRDDFKDLEEKIKWCEDNRDKSIEIIMNAHSYLKQFDNLSREKEIENKVIEKHLSLVYYS